MFVLFSQVAKTEDIPLNIASSNSIEDESAESSQHDSDNSLVCSHLASRQSSKLTLNHAIHFFYFVLSLTIPFSPWLLSKALADSRVTSMINLANYHLNVYTNAIFHFEFYKCSVWVKRCVCISCCTAGGRAHIVILYAIKTFSSLRISTALFFQTSQVSQEALTLHCYHGFVCIMCNLVSIFANE